MRFRSWLWLLAPVLLAGRLQAQEPLVGVRLGLAGEWGTIPGRVDYANVAAGIWGGSATLEIRHPALPHLAFVTRVGHVPERTSPAAPKITTLAGGVRLALWRTGRLATSAGLEVEGVYFSPAAYNAAVCGVAGCFWPGPILELRPGWRGGMSVSPGVELWPSAIMGLRFAPALRWLGPIGNGGPSDNAVFVTLALGVVFRMRP